MDLISIIKALTDFGFQTMLTGFFFFFSYKFIDQKFFSKDDIQRQRDTNDEIDARENQESKMRLKRLQLYLLEHQEEIFTLGVDRCSVWLNHNGMRNGKIHFIFYSLVAEVTKKGLQVITEHPIGSQKLPYYIFAEYEDRLLQEGAFFEEDAQAKPGGSSFSIAKDLGTKSMFCLPIFSLSGSIDGMIFFSSAYSYLKKKPDVQKIADDIRILFIS